MPLILILLLVVYLNGICDGVGGRPFMEYDVTLYESTLFMDQSLERIFGERSQSRGRMLIQSAFTSAHY